MSTPDSWRGSTSEVVESRGAGFGGATVTTIFATRSWGLMKTQMVKNSIIVPVGSKGGFVLKGKLPPRPALDTHLMERYREFISGLFGRHRQHRRRPRRTPARRGPSRWRRPLSSRGRRQGHRPPIRHSQHRVQALRFLARRCVRIGRQRRLRPQESRDHGAGRLGMHQAPLRQSRRRRDATAVFLRGHRGHGWGCVR